MADPDANYLTNAEISASFYNGQEVPNANTIAETPNLNLKNRVDNYINHQILLRSETGNLTETWKVNVLKDPAYILYAQARAGKNLNIKEADKRRIRKIINGGNFGWGNQKDYARGNT